MLVHAVGQDAPGSAPNSHDLDTASQTTGDTLLAIDTILGGHLVMCIELPGACD